jgi:hypothetical protein
MPHKPPSPRQLNYLKALAERRSNVRLADELIGRKP